MDRKTIFLDTNIVADMIDAKRPHHTDAVNLLKIALEQSINMVISEDMISTLYYISGDKKATLDFFEHIVFPYWTVADYGLSLLKKATNISLQKGQDLEDMLQCLCAKKEGCSIVVTEDQNFVDCGIDVVDYESFLSDKYLG